MLRLGKQLAVIPRNITPDFGAWLAQHSDQVFRLRTIRGDGYFQALGLEAEACREPLNITSRAPGPLKLISNFAHTPFDLDGCSYGSVEAFWQGLKFSDEAKRRELAPLHGAKPKDLAYRAAAAEIIFYRGARVRIGTWDHWQLMERACTAKFVQHEGARDALLSTGRRPLVHEMKRDSKTIPGVIMAQIWIRCRERLQSKSQLR